MPGFNFFKDIDVREFKRTMKYLGETIDEENLAESFENTILDIIIERVKSKKPLNADYLERYGFSSGETFLLFLKDPIILEKIKIGIGKPEDLSSVENLSSKLLEKIIAAHQSAQKTNETRYC